jgi:hypothetical protein
MVHSTFAARPLNDLANPPLDGRAYRIQNGGVYRVIMKRKLTIVGIFVGLAAAMVLAVLVISYRPTQSASRQALTFTSEGKVVVQPPESRANMMIVSDMPRGTKLSGTNAAPVVK